MAEVKYQREPTVSVHGVPKSEYEAGALPQSGGGGGMMASFKQHWMWWAAAGGILIIAYIIYVKYGNKQSTTAAIDPNTGLPVGATSPDQLWGSQLDANMQQIMSFQNQLLGYFNGSGNNPAPGTPPPTVTPPSQPGPYKPPIGVQNPIPLPSPNPQYHTDTVHGGDTLWGIAQKTGFPNWQALLNFGNNYNTVKTTAQAHGQWNPADPGHWIYPGEVLQVH